MGGARIGGTAIITIGLYNAWNELDRFFKDFGESYLMNECE